MPILTNQRSRFLGGGQLPVPVPVLGAELLTNGDMETGDPPSSWTSANTTLARETTNIHGGAAALKGTAAASNANTNQSVTATGNAWYLCIAWGKAGAAANQWRMSTFMAGGGGISGTAQSAETYTQVFQVVRSTTGETALQLQFRIVTSGQVAYWDDASVKRITLASMFSTRPYSTHVTVKAQATIVAGTRAGVVCNLDNATSPANFVIGSHDGTTARLTKCVGGTYTELISTAVTYVAGAYVEIRRTAGTDTYKLYYNNSQVGTDQTISDAGITGNVLAGMFNSYSGNSLAAFSCVPS